MWPGGSEASDTGLPHVAHWRGAVWIGLVTGLAAEARIAAPLGPTLAGGGTTHGAEAAARRLARAGARALVSFGLAGGLDPSLAPGTLIIPAEVYDDEVAYPCDAALASRWGTMAGRLLASHEAVTSAAGKARLFAVTGARAVDMESGAVARVAREFNLPFACLRAICDPAARSLPHAARVALDPSGRISPLRLLASLARTPGQIPELIALGRDAAAARRTLRALR